MVAPFPDVVYLNEDVVALHHGCHFTSILRPFEHGITINHFRGRHIAVSINVKLEKYAISELWREKISCNGNQG
jgi:hypothetical protein